MGAALRKSARVPGSGKAPLAKGPANGRGKRADAPERPRASLYAEVTARIVAELEAGRVPWVQPWDSAAASPGLPRNAATGRAYSGINILLLWAAQFKVPATRSVVGKTAEGAVIERGYATQGWLTFRQAVGAGGCVRKGEQGVGVVFADRFTPEAEKARAAETGDDPRQIPFLKRFTLFNVAQCDGIPEAMTAAAPPLPTREIVPVAEGLIVATGADFRIGGDKAFYSPVGDFVSVPPQPAFASQINYYRTALHELGHWTGHPSRLARDLSGRFGSPGYAREELCAELASAYLCAALGIAPTVRHADYIGSWLEVLRADDRAIFRAASQASKAADYLLACQSAAATVEAAA